MKDRMLEVHDLLENGGEVYRVVSVSECAAVCVPVQTKPVTIEDRLTGRRRTFTPTGRSVRFSAYSPRKESRQ